MCPNDVPNLERTGKRDSFPSRLRRHISPKDGCFQLDLDMVEGRYVRNNLILVAVCEYKPLGHDATDFQKDILLRIALGENTLTGLLRCKSLIIEYEEGLINIDDSHLLVREIYPDIQEHYFNVAQFQAYIRSL